MRFFLWARDVVEGDNFIGRLWRAKFIRYSMISAICVVVSAVIQTVALTLMFRFGWFSNDTKAATANGIATVLTTPISFVLNRTWAWGETGKSHVFKQHLPFWGMAILGFVLSLLTVHFADAWAVTRGWSPEQRTAFANVANLAAFGFLWIAKFVVINSFLFVQHKQHPEVPAHAEGEEHGEVAPPFVMEELPQVPAAAKRSASQRSSTALVAGMTITGESRADATHWVV